MYKILSLSILLLLAASCEPEGPTTGCNSDFDQSAMFQNIADNIIVPSFQDLQTQTTALVAKKQAFLNAPSISALEDLRHAWFQAYLAFQKVSQFDFGPAEEVFLRNSVNNFPLDTAAMLANIQSGNYNFDMPDNYDKGLPALDYLLYGIGNDDNAIISKLSDAAYSQYLSDVIDDIQQRVDHTVKGWTDGYKDTFISNTGTAAGSSLSLIINDWNENYEITKRDRLGIPSGVLTLGFTNPDKVEAYYSGRSLELLKVALSASEQLYLGVTDNGTDQLGLDDFLVAIDAIKGDYKLNDLIKNQFVAAKNAVDGLTNPLSENVENDTPQVVDAYNEVVKQLVNIKTDLPSVLCVSITYIDNPSDND